jgi:hypothetical protein
VLEVMGLITLHTYSYCLTGVLVRRGLTTYRLRPGHTWVVTLVLVTFGIAIPFLVAFFLSLGRPYARYDDFEHVLWGLTNPIMAGIDAPYRWWYIGFAGVWAVAVTLMNLPWFIRQVEEFRPYQSKATTAST